MNFDDKQRVKPKKSILNKFRAKRSCKVEPHPFVSTTDNDGSDDNGFEQLSMSAKSTPAHRSKHHLTSSTATTSTTRRLNKFWRCYYSMQSVNNSIDSSNFETESFLRIKKSNDDNLLDNRKSYPEGSNQRWKELERIDYQLFNNDVERLECEQENQNDERQSDNNNSANSGNDLLRQMENGCHDTNTNASTDVGLVDRMNHFSDGEASSSFTNHRFTDTIDAQTSASPLMAQQKRLVRVDSTPDLHGKSIASPSMLLQRSRLRRRFLPPKSYSVDTSPPRSEHNHSFPSITASNSTLLAPPSLSSTSSSANRSLSHDMLSNFATTHNTDRIEKLPRNFAQLRQSQQINLIPTEFARERKQLNHRMSIHSLMGPSELDRVLPSREIRVFIGTWNMNGHHPPNDMNDFVLPASVEHVPDLIAIGTQESCSERFEWEVTIQETIGPSHVMFHSASLGTLHLAVFIRRDLIWFCSVPEDDCLSVRPGTAFRTKGAIAISFCIFGTSMLFVTSHLTAHQQKVKERVSDVKRIIHSLDLPKNLHLRSKNRDVTQNFDAVFWCGDLNFRLGEPREKLLKWIETTKFPLPPHLPHGYMHTDQLKSVLANGAAFKDFKEAQIRFPPTYKYDPGTQKFDTSSKQRAPAYTDRILYKFKSNPFGIRRDSNLTNFLHCPTIENVAYDSVPSIISSDHKPVWALFKVSVKPGIDSIPLAAGLFNRDVYIEGMKRRLSKTATTTSNACCIQ